MRRIALAAALLVGAAALALAAGLVWAHREMRGLDPPLPEPEELRAFAAAPDLPVRLRAVNTASQVTPRRLVLDPARDPTPDAPYVMSHPAFVLEWADGRRLLVDAGMDRAATRRAFGRPIEWMGGGSIEAHASLAERVGPELNGRRVGIAFTHLHIDHVDGVHSLCRALDGRTRIALFQRRAQAERVNFTTRVGRAWLDTAGCLEAIGLEEVPAAAVPGFAGVFVIHAAGHTPGSQIVGAWVAGAGGPRGWLFAGDVANAIDGIRRDVPKPWAYQTFVVPESEARLQRLRSFLRQAADRVGFTVLLSHDELHLVELGLLAR